MHQNCLVLFVHQTLFTIHWTVAIKCSLKYKSCKSAVISLSNFDEFDEKTSSYQKIQKRKLLSPFVVLVYRMITGFISVI